MSKTTRPREACSYCGSSNNICYWTYNGREISRCKTPDCEYNDIQKNNQESNPTRSTQEDSFITSGDFKDIPDRGISEEACREYDYRVGIFNGNECHIANAYEKGKIIGQKIRIVKSKEFFSIGDIKSADLFGGHLPIKDYNNIFVTEGEFDALSLRMLMPEATIRSLWHGAGNQTITEINKNKKFLNKFNKVWLIFDNDTDDKLTGQETAEKVAKIFAPGKIKIVKLRYKDPNEYLKKKELIELAEDISKTMDYVPPSIKIPTKEFLATPSAKGYKLPYPMLNNSLRGLKPGRLYTLLAGSGIGKSSFTKELAYAIMKTQPDLKIGLAYLEEPLSTSGLSFIALETNTPLYLLEESVECLGDQYSAAYNETIGSGRIQFIDASFMKLDGEDLIYNLEFLVKGLGCNLIILDHITMITYDSNGEQSERKDIDILMKQLRTLVHKTNAIILAVVHLKRPMHGASWADGREVQMTDARGSAAIEQLSDVMIALERNMNDDMEKTKTKIKVLKNRVTGLTGYVDTLHYIENTGRLLTLDNIFGNKE